MWRPVLGAVALIWSCAAGAVETSGSVTGSAGTGETSEAQTLSAASGTTGAQESTSATLPVGGREGGSKQLSREWQERLQSTGYMPEDFAARSTPKLDEEAKTEVEVRRHYLLARYYLEAGQVTRAVEEFKAALDDEPESVQILHGLVDAHIAASQFREAEAILDQILKNDPDDVEALLQKSQILIARSENAGQKKPELLRQAVDLLVKARRLQPKNMKILEGLAAAYIGLQDIEKIVQAYRDIIKADPRDLQATLVLANVLAETGKVQEAVSLYERVIEENRGYPTTHLFLGQLYEKIRQLDKAIETYRRALIINPRNERVRQRYEQALRRKYGEQNLGAVVQEYERFASQFPQSSGIQRLFAERLVAAQNYRRAIEQYRRVVEIDPENVEVLVTLAQLLLQNREYEPARKYLQKAVDVDPTRVDAYNALAESYVAQGNTESAAEVYRKALRLNPEQDKLLIALADVLSRTGDAQAAIKTLEDMVTTGSAEKPEFLAVMGQAHERARNYEKAAEFYNRALEKAPGSLAIIGKLLTVNLRRGDVTAAEQLTSKVLENGSLPKDDVYALSGEAFLAEGLQPQAAEAYKKAYQANPDSGKLLERLIAINNLRDAHQENFQILERVAGSLADGDNVQELRAQTLLDQKRYPEALEIYRSLQAAHPSSDDWVRKLIDALITAQQYDEALQVVSKHTDLLGREDASALRGVILYKARRYAQSERVFRDLLKTPGLSPGDSSTFYFYLGSIALDQRRYEAAERAFRSAIQANPINDSALNALGYMLADRNEKLTEAKDLIEKALSIDPSAPHILDSMGWVLFRLGQYEEALDYVQRAHRLTGDDPEILEHLGDIFVKLGQQDKAQRAYRRAFEMDPQRPGLRGKLVTQSR